MNNFFLLSAITLCLGAGLVRAQYQTAPAYGNGYQQQRKMSPSPSGYGQRQQQQSPQTSYQSMQMADMAPMSEPTTMGYEQQQSGSDEQNAYGAQQQSPSSSSYKQQGSAKAMSSGDSYGAQSSMGGGYGKQAAKYEEPQHPPMPFAWGYDINDGYGTTQYHKENGDEQGKRTGSYGYMDAYGVYRHVNYVADENGFRATIKTNEPGTANESPADVDLTAEEPPANTNPGNKDVSGGYGSSSSNKYASDQSSMSNEYGQSGASAMSMSAKSSYGGASMGESSKYSGAPENSMMAEQSTAQKYGGSSMSMADQPAAMGKQYGGQSQTGSGRQQYGAGMAQGMMAALMARSRPQSMSAGGSQYAQQGAMAQGARSMKSSRKYGSQGGSMNGMRPMNGYQAKPEPQMTMMGQSYGATMNQQGGQYGAMGGQGRMMASGGQQYGQTGAFMDDSMSQQGYGSDSTLAQQYGPSSMLGADNGQMQQYGSANEGTSTYSSTRMQPTSSSYGTKSSAGSNTMDYGAQKQQANAMMMMAPAGAGSDFSMKAGTKGMSGSGTSKRY